MYWIQFATHFSRLIFKLLTGMSSTNSSIWRAHSASKVQEVNIFVLYFMCCTWEANAIQIWSILTLNDQYINIMLRIFCYSFIVCIHSLHQQFFGLYFLIKSTKPGRYRLFIIRFYIQNAFEKYFKISIEHIPFEIICL